MKNCRAILLAAGSGTRFCEKKQDVLFHNKPLWRFAYETTAKVVGQDRVLVVGKEIPGGKTRMESVLRGLEVLPDDTQRVIIVEAARPMVTETQILTLCQDASPSASFVMPLVNTVVYRKGEFIDRGALYELLTPQAFDYKLLLEAYRSGQFTDTTDETRPMFEYHGIKPHFIETGRNLFKVTYPGDLVILQSIYESQMKESGI